MRSSSCAIFAIMLCQVQVWVTSFNESRIRFTSSAFSTLIVLLCQFRYSGTGCQIHPSLISKTVSDVWNDTRTALNDYSRTLEYGQQTKWIFKHLWWKVANQKSRDVHHLLQLYTQTDFGRFSSISLISYTTGAHQFRLASLVLA